ncbi:MAG: hypothetical protein OEV92_00475 [Nitrospinota bacterium]|nr:hypothetical protein [Nitrospinota bacterium]
MRLVKIVSALLLVFFLTPNLAPAEHIDVKNDELQAALRMDKNMHSYIRLSGILTDLLRTLNTEYAKRHSAEQQQVSQEAESLLNDAGMAASEGDYEASFVILEKAAKIIMDAIAKLNAGS